MEQAGFKGESVVVVVLLLLFVSPVLPCLTLADSRNTSSYLHKAEDKIQHFTNNAGKKKYLLKREK